MSREIPQERRHLTAFLEEMIASEPFMATAELTIAAADHFGSDQIGDHDVIMALQRLVKRGRIMRLQTSTESRFMDAGGKPAETLAMVCNACELYFVYMDETEALWTDLGAVKRY